jgi:heterodisulfide reductase subunit C1
MTKIEENLHEQLKHDVRYIEGMRSCINCGICTAICPAAKFHEYDPRILMDQVQNIKENELIELLKSETIWYCGQCLSCKTRCPRSNVPGMIISALRALSQEKGYFSNSIEGRKQLIVKQIVGENILKHGYCVYIDEIGLEAHPEQGPVWEWYKNNADSILKKLGANYKGKGEGTLRNISEADLLELKNIMKETGAMERFDKIEKYCDEKRGQK